jgi:hypothetical protein
VIEHPATGPLRSGSAEAFRTALVGALVEGEHEWVRDFRDLLMALAPFHDCARKLGLDAAAEFRAAAAEGPASLRDVVAEFGARHDITPAAFAFTVVDEPGGPAYRYV